MKKILVILLILVVISGSIWFISVNRNKTPITTNDFATTMKNKDYTVLDITNQYSQHNYIKEAIVASSSDFSYRVEFYTFSSEQYAIAVFNENKLQLEKAKQSPSKEKSISLKNYSVYTLITKDKYQTLSRVGDTMILAFVDSSHTDVVKELVKEFGY